MNCMICNEVLSKESCHFEIYYTLTSHSNTLFSDYIKKVLKCDSNEFHSRYICKHCFELLEKLDFAESTCTRLKKQIHDRCCTNKNLNLCLKDASCQTENVENQNDGLSNLLSFEETTDFLKQMNGKSPEQKTKLYECNQRSKKCTLKGVLQTNERKQRIEERSDEISELKRECDLAIGETESSRGVKNEPDNDDISERDDVSPSVPAGRKRSLRNNGSPKPAKHQCPQCPKMWRTTGELRTHVATHSKLRPYICEVCGQAYKHKQALDVHVGMHNGINPFSCQYCHKAFTQKGALQRHLPIHTGEAPYQCDLCGKRFVHHTSFNMHTLAHTGQKAYKCNICGLALLSNSHLKRHSRVHTGERPYACSHCGKRFAERYNLAAHQRLHENVATNVPGTSNTNSKRSHRCQVCGAVFDRRPKLEEHLSSSHNKISEGDEQSRKWLGHFLGNVGA